jgi:hypothetical protein
MIAGTLQETRPTPFQDENLFDSLAMLDTAEWYVNLSACDVDVLLTKAIS